MAGPEPEPEPAVAKPPAAPRRRRAPKIHVPDDAAAPGRCAGADGEAVAEEAPDADTVAETAAEAGEPSEDGAPRPHASGHGVARAAGGTAARSTVANGDGAPPRRPRADGPQDTPDDVATAPDDRPMAPDDVALDAASGAEQAGGYVPMSEWIEDFDRRR